MRPNVHNEGRAPLLLAPLSILLLDGNCFFPRTSEYKRSFVRVFGWYGPAKYFQLRNVVSFAGVGVHYLHSR